MANKGRGNMGELGELLRTRREDLGLSLSQVHEATHIQIRQLINMEAENYDELPAEVYLRGLLRIYARHLGLDPHDVMEIYEESRGRKIADESFQEPDVRSLGRAWLTSDLFIGILVVLGLVVVGLWASSRYLLSPQPESLPSESTPTHPLLMPTLVPASSPGLTLTVRANGRIFLKVTLDGEHAFEGRLERGEERNLHAEEAIGIHTANAGDTLVSLGGEPWYSLGKRGTTASWGWLRVEEGIAIAQVGGQSTP